MKTIHLDDELPTQSLSIRVTELEKFANCPYQYKYWEWSDDKDALEYWKQTHLYLQSLTVSDDRWKRIEQSLRKTWECKRTWELIEYWRLLKQKWAFPEWSNVLYLEKQMIVCFVINWYKVYVSGTCDLARDNGLKWDFKTSKWERKEQDVQYKLQWKFYPYLDEIITGESQKWLEFLIFTKHVVPRFQQFLAPYNYDDSWSLMFYLLNKLTKCYIANEFPTKPARTVSCNRCPIKESCIIYEDYKTSQRKLPWQEES